MGNSEGTPLEVGLEGGDEEKEGVDEKAVGYSEGEGEKGHFGLVNFVYFQFSIEGR